MNKYKLLEKSLTETGKGVMKCYGNSMLPILTNPSTCSYQVEKDYYVGDIVFSRVKGRYIDAHIITQKSEDGRFLISNNKGHNNGWTRKVFGRVICATSAQGFMKYVAKQREDDIV